MSKKLNSFLTKLFVILSVVYLTGCNFANHTENLICTDVGGSSSIHLNDQTYLTFLPCTYNEILAIVQPDGNIYIYDICQDNNSQITFDGQAYDDSRRQTNTYYFFDSATTWSPDGNWLVVGKNFKAYIIDLPTKSQKLLDETVIATSWSPDSQRLAIIKTLAEPLIYYNDNDYNEISIFNIEKVSEEITVEGNAPIWINSTELIYFSVTNKQEPEFLHNLTLVKLTERSEILGSKLRTSYSSTRYGRLSPDQNHVAVHSPSGSLSANLAILTLDMPEIFSEELTVANAIGGHWYLSNSYNWSPTKPVLAVCTAGEGSHDGASLAKSHGAVLLINANQVERVFNEQRCLISSQVSWHPSGEMVAFLNTDYNLSFIDSIANSYVDIPTEPNNLRIEKGPWWSPSGNYIGVITDNKVYVAEFNEEKLEFEYLMDGVEMSWQPLQ